MLKIFQKKREEVTNAIPADADLSQFEVEVNGKMVPLAEIVNAVKKNEDDEAAAKKKAEEEKENVLNDDTEVSVGDQKMTMGDLLNKYNAMQKKNADDEAAAEAKKKAEEEKTNALEKEKKVKEDAEKAEELKRFEEFRNANKNVTLPTAVDLSQDKMARGKSRYGSGK